MKKQHKIPGDLASENDVRLEFSNNPDSNGEGSTGYTPWDTVVCFTYKLNGLKPIITEQNWKEQNSDYIQIRT